MVPRILCTVIDQKSTERKMEISSVIDEFSTASSERVTSLWRTPPSSTRKKIRGGQPEKAVAPQSGAIFMSKY